MLISVVCRLRRRICKHIRLVLVELGIEDSPAAWHQVKASKACAMIIRGTVPVSLLMCMLTSGRRSPVRFTTEPNVVVAVQAVEQTLPGGSGPGDVRSEVEDEPKAQNEGAGKSKRQAMQHKDQRKPQTRAKKRKLPPSIASRA